MGLVLNSRQRAQRVVEQASSVVEGLIGLFEIDDFPGADAPGRLGWILRITKGGYPGMQLGLFPAGDSGFLDELGDEKCYTDPRCWAGFLKPQQRTTLQMGHFLTAVAIAYRPCLEWVKLNLVTGHEKRGDGMVFTFLRQFLSATAEDRRRVLKAVEHDAAGAHGLRDRELQFIFGSPGEALPDRRRIGNSMPDLRLSVKGWRFAHAIRRGEIHTRQEAADWLKREIYDPARVREPAKVSGQ